MWRVSKSPATRGLHSGVSGGDQDATVESSKLAERPCRRAQSARQAGQRSTLLLCRSYVTETSTLLFT